MQAETDAKVSVLSRFVRILEAFDSSTKSLTASDIARRSGLPMPSAHRLIGQMLELGLLERDSQRRIQVGVRLWELASRSQEVLSLREVAKPFLQDVQAIVGHHTQLGVMEGNDVLFVELLSNEKAVINITKVASRLPLHSCSSGLVLLAYSSPAVQERIFASTLKPMTSETILEPAALRRELAQVRQQGFAVSRGAVHSTAAGVAAPVRDRHNQVIATISVIVPNDQRHTSFAIPVLLAAARGMSRALGAKKLDDAEGWISQL